MATAACENCRHLIHWRARRGNRLADHSCPTCGGKLRAKRDDANDNAMTWYGSGRPYRADGWLNQAPAGTTEGQAGQP